MFELSLATEETPELEAMAVTAEAVGPQWSQLAFAGAMAVTAGREALEARAVL